VKLANRSLAIEEFLSKKKEMPLFGFSYLVKFDVFVKNRKNATFWLLFDTAARAMCKDCT
jgi:hypothetical protein